MGRNGALRVGLAGTFEVDNYGDLLFPLIAQAELSRRLLGAEFVWMGPVGRPGNEAWPEVIRLGAASPERREHWAQRLDALVIGGGDLIHPHSGMLAHFYGVDSLDLPLIAWYPWLVEGLPGRPLIWNAVGVPEPITGTQGATAPAYAAVRGENSKVNASPLAPDAAVVADTAVLLPRLFTTDRAREVASRLRAERRLPAGHTVVQAHGGIAERLADYLVELSRSRHLVVIQIGPVHDDGDLQRLLRGLEGVTILEPPLSLEAVTALIATADSFVGSSLHGAIVAAAYGVPFLSIDADRARKRIEMMDLLGMGERLVGTEPDDEPLTRAPKLSPEIEDAVDLHFDRIAEIIEKAAAERGEPLQDLDWVDRPEISHATLSSPPTPLTFSSPEIAALIHPVRHPPIPRDMKSLLGVLDKVRVLPDRQSLSEEVATLRRALTEHQSLIEKLAAEAEHRQTVIDELASEAEHRLTVIDELALEAELRQTVIDELASEAAHRLDVIQELDQLATQRLEMLQGITAERDEKSARLARIEQVIDANHLLRWWIRRRLSEREL